MLYLDINGRQLLLHANTECDVEHTNPLFADGVEDGYSMAIEVPAEGNEDVLRHVHEPALDQRTLKFTKAHLGHHGTTLFPGTLHVLSSVPRSVRTTFIVDGFADEVKGVMLPDTLRGLVVDLESNAWQRHTMPLYEDDGVAQFPMYYNPDLFGDTNVAWAPSNISAYSVSTVYAVNALVKFTDRSGSVESVDVWQCTTLTSPGEDPLNTPAKWRKTAFGVVNAWDKETSTFYENAEAGNFYTWVPWLYLKWVLSKAMEAVGYHVQGSFMRDAGTHEFVVANNTTIEQQPQPPEEFLFRATEDAPVHYTAASTYPGIHIQATDDTTTPNVDDEDLWDADTGEFICPAAGLWRFRVRLQHNRRGNALHSNFYFLRMVAAGLPTVMRAEVFRPMPNDPPYETTMDIVYQFGSGDVGQRFIFTTYQGSRSVPYGQPTWPTVTSDCIVDAYVSGWPESLTLPTSVPDTLIHPYRHVPNMSLLEFINSIAGGLNLEVIPDTVARTISFNYKEDAIRQLHTERTDHSHRMVNDTEIDHARRTKGMRISLPADELDDDTALDAAPIYTDASEVPTPWASGLTAVLRNTREVLRSDFVDGTFCYRKSKYHVPPMEVGDTQDTTDVELAVKVPHAVTKSLDEEWYVMPYWPQEGTSDFYQITTDLTELVIAKAVRVASRSADVDMVPTATSWGYGFALDQRYGFSALPYSADPLLPGLGDAYWARWAHMLTTAEPVTIDLLTDTPFLRGREWRRALHMQGQDYLIQRLPMTYGMEHGPLLCVGAHALRIMPYAYAPPVEVGGVKPAITLSFTLIGEDHTGTFTADTTTGYYAYTMDGGEVVIVDLSSASDVAIEGEHFKAWPCSADGHPQGEFLYVRIEATGAGRAFNNLDIAILAGSTLVAMELLYLADAALVLPSLEITEAIYVEPSETPSLSAIDMSAATLAGEATVSYATNGLDILIMPAIHSLNFIEANINLSDSLNQLLANLRSNNYTGHLRTEGAAPTGDGITDKAWLIGNGADITTP